VSQLILVTEKELGCKLLIAKLIYEKWYLTYIIFAFYNHIFT